MLEYLLYALGAVIILVTFGLYSVALVGIGYLVGLNKVKFLQRKPIVPAYQHNQPQKDEFIRDWMLANPSFSREDYLGTPKGANIPSFQKDVKRGDPKA